MIINYFNSQIKHPQSVFSWLACMLQGSHVCVIYSLCSTMYLLSIHSSSSCVVALVISWFV